MASCGFPQTDDCVQVVRNMKTVQVPCTRNTYQKYSVKVPRQVTHQVPRTVRYTDYENRTKQVPYTVNRSEKRMRMETQKYTVPITTTKTRMVPVTKKVPKTVYVSVTTSVPQQYTTTTMQTRERQVPVPYFVNVPETKYRTITEQVPVPKTKIEMDTRMKTVYDTQVKTRCVPETKMVTKQIPVYNVVARPAPMCPPPADYGTDTAANLTMPYENASADFYGVENDVDVPQNYNEVAFNMANTNNSQPIANEYYNTGASVNVATTEGRGDDAIAYGQPTRIG